MVNKKINVKKHKRYDPRLGKKVDVGSYDRKQRFNQYKNVSGNDLSHYFDYDIKKFTTIRDLTAYIEDLMGSEGSHEEAIALTTLLLEQDFFELEGDGYHSTKKWLDEDKYNFTELWEEAYQKSINE